MVCKACGILNNEEVPVCRNCHTRFVLSKRQNKDYLEYRNHRTIKWWEFALTVTCVFIIPGLIMGGIYFKSKRHLSYIYLITTLAAGVIYAAAYLCLKGMMDAGVL